MLFSSLKSDHLKGTIHKNRAGRQAHTDKEHEAKTTGTPGPAFSPGIEKTTATAAFQGAGFSSSPPGSNFVFFSLPLSLSLGLVLVRWGTVFDAADVVVILVPARVSTRSVDEEMSSPWFDPMPTSK